MVVEMVERDSGQKNGTAKIHKAGDLARRFPLKKKRRSTQYMKDEARKGWKG
jgi:hypothetical protein